MAPLLFACGLRPRLRALEDGLRAAAVERGLRAEDVRVLAYLDDVVVLTPPELAVEVLPRAQRAFGQVGLDLRPDKTQAWSERAPCPPGLEEQWCESGITLVGVCGNTQS